MGRGTIQKFKVLFFQTPMAYLKPPVVSDFFEIETFAIAFHSAWVAGVLVLVVQATLALPTSWHSDICYLNNIQLKRDHSCLSIWSVEDVEKAGPIENCRVPCSPPRMPPIGSLLRQRVNEESNLKHLSRIWSVVDPLTNSITWVGE